MRKRVMGKVNVRARVENLDDLYQVQRGKLRPEEVRVIEIEQALVDTGATLLFLPPSMIAALGLKLRRTRPGQTASGPRDFHIYDPVQLTVDGRDCIIEVAEVPEGSPPLIGVIALEMLDVIVDPVNQRLLGNPAHGGEQMIEVYSFFDPKPA